MHSQRQFPQTKYTCRHAEFIRKTDAQSEANKEKQGRQDLDSGVDPNQAWEAEKAKDNSTQWK
jgi:hypothetical protein